MFNSEFRVHNRSGEKIYITCVGQWEPLKPRMLSILPQHDPNLYFPSPRWDRELPIAPNTARKVVYNWDDINFLAIVVRGEHGDYRLLRTGVRTDCCCYRHDRDDYIVPPLKRLPLASAEMVEATRYRMQRGGLIRIAKP